MRRYDWILILAAFLLFSLGLAAIASVELSRGGHFAFVEKQLVALGIGLALGVFAARANFQLFRSYARIAYFGGIILLLGLFLFGSTLNGTTGWYIIGGFAFQPVEVMKLGLILELARYFADDARRPFGSREFLGSGIRLAVPLFLVLLQPDFGSAILLLGIWAITAFFAGLELRHAAVLAAIVALGFLIGWFGLFQDYQKDRIRNFLYPASDPLVSGYNVLQAEVAIGAGGFIGRGLGGGSQSQLRFLPESQSDFIFAVIAEELGFLGILLIFTGYALLLSRMLKLAYQSRDYFASSLVIGIFALFFMQIVIHIGANLAVMPATGIPLPLVSYGGTSLLLSLALLGTVESVAART
ncbi:MAG: FtsW/RodA/SpoVE family cell cycle protein [Patescibacteria group bacterium]|jgi:rod shape determining protein RodA